jgi:glycosyltransferase involved in cell wall biosynthesis
LKIWLINAYGNLPTEGWSEYRTTLMANALSEAGHEVVWWVSNFEHRSKKYRSESWKDIRINDNFTIKIVPSTSYIKHISFARIKYERIFCHNLYNKILEIDERPDFVIVGEPALFTSDIISKLIKKLNTRLIIDIIDLWPELFKIFLPNYLKRYERLIFWPFYHRRNLFLKKADAIIAVSNDYLELGKKYSNANFYDTIYWGLNSKRIENLFLKENIDSVFSEHLIPIKKVNDFFVIYAGTLGENYDIFSILQAALNLQLKDIRHIKIIIAGDGPLKNTIINFIHENNLKNLFFIGRINNDTLHCLFSECDLSLCTYVSNSTVSMPIKFYDYISAGLPILCSLKREIGSLILKYKIGLVYISEDAVDLEKKMYELSINRPLIKEMKNNANNLAFKFSYKNQYQKIVDLINKMI